MRTHQLSSCKQARQEEIAALQAKVMELSRENTLLKRAVTIQQSRLQEGDAASKQQASQAEAVIADLQVGLPAVSQMPSYCSHVNAENIQLHSGRVAMFNHPKQTFLSLHPDVCRAYR